MELSYKCPRCKNKMPFNNKILHDLKCTEEHPAKLNNGNPKKPHSHNKLLIKNNNIIQNNMVNESNINRNYNHQNTNINNHRHGISNNLNVGNSIKYNEDGTTTEKKVEMDIDGNQIITITRYDKDHNQISKKVIKNNLNNNISNHNHHHNHNRNQIINANNRFNNMNHNPNMGMNNIPMNFNNNMNNMRMNNIPMAMNNNNMPNMGINNNFSNIPMNNMLRNNMNRINNIPMNNNLSNMPFRPNNMMMNMQMNNNMMNMQMNNNNMMNMPMNNNMMMNFPMNHNMMMNMPVPMMAPVPFNGTDPNILNNLPETRIKEVENLDPEKKECVICLEEFNNDELVTSLPCIHSFHTHCIKSWLQRNNECPICKFKITYQSINGQ